MAQRLEQQSFDRAASVLSITRGAVSQRIKALEESPGEPLDKCRALWALITTGQEAELMKVLNEAPTHNLNPADKASTEVLDTP